MPLHPDVPKWQLATHKEGDLPSALDIVKRENISLRGKTALVTGASDGIGAETARALAAVGARVFVIVRNVPKGQAVLDKINAEFPDNGGLEIIQGDFSSLASINAAANEFLKRSNQLHILVNNAGSRYPKHELTEDGFETNFETCHIAHHLLFKKLVPLLIKSSTLQFNSRVVVVSSAAHLFGGIDFNDLNFTKRPFDADFAYRQAKTANILFANQVEKLYGAQGVHAVSLNPGLVDTKGVAELTHQESINLGLFTPEGDYALPVLTKTVPQGAATTAWAAVSASLEGKGGLYLDDCAVAKPNVSGEWTGYAAAAFDEGNAAKLWKLTEDAVSKYVKA